MATSSPSVLNIPGNISPALLGLFPALAIATTLINGVSIGIIVALVFVLTALICSLMRNRISVAWRIPFLLTVCALLTTLVQMNLAAYLFALYATLGVFVTLVAANSLIFTRGLEFAFQQPPGTVLKDALVLSIKVIATLTLLGAVREFVARGSLFAGAEIVFGPDAKNWLWHPLPKNYSFILAGMAPGALIILGLLLGLKNLIWRGSPGTTRHEPR